MTRLIIHINDPRSEKKVEALLESVEGIEVERDPKKVVRKAAAKRNPKPKPKAPLTAAEKRFMKDLTEAFKSVEDHFSGKKKLPTLREVLDDL
jgi:DNA replication initiation complex subunit (GINS family)